MNYIFRVGRKGAVEKNMYSLKGGTEEGFKIRPRTDKMVKTR
jgi:hypothetical protein